MVVTTTLLVVLGGCGGGPAPLSRAGAAAPTIGPDGVTAVSPAAETDLFPQADGDVADDSAIWRNPDDPGASLVLGGNKSDAGGVGVFDLQGKTRSYLRSGKIGNIDVRPNHPLGGRRVALVGANDRSDDTLKFWALDPAGTLSPVDAGPIRTLERNYGFCLGASANGATVYAFVTQEGGGMLEQFELADQGGKVGARRVRSIDVGSQSEGCAVDDVTGAVYVAEEDVGIWRYRLDPASGAARSAVDRTGAGRLEADVEGVAVVRGADGRGVLVVSSQGDSTFAVYNLDGGNAYRGSFQIRARKGVDGVSKTDGLAVQAGGFGPAFPNGLLVVHDGENTDQGNRAEPSSNLKLVRFDHVVALAPPGR
jgi:3-phytase